MLGKSCRYRTFSQLDVGGNSGDPCSAWRSRLRGNCLTLMVAVLCLVACGAATNKTGRSVPSARSLPVPSASAATAAFRRYLHHRYGETHGYALCAAAQSFPITGSRSCLAEVETSGEWHQLVAAAQFQRRRIVFPSPVVTTWTRHWWPYSRRFILVGPTPRASGVISVNGPAYDWWLLAQCAHRVRKRRQCIDLDGPAKGFFRFYSFICTAPRSNYVVCTNSLGDVMRYQPNGNTA